MTAGHKHREFHVPRWLRWLVPVLRFPLYITDDLDRVDRSPYPYGQVGYNDDLYYLSTLGVLHRWFGLTLVVDMNKVTPRR